MQRIKRIKNIFVTILCSRPRFGCSCCCCCMYQQQQQ